MKKGNKRAVETLRELLTDLGADVEVHEAGDRSVVRVGAGGWSYSLAPVWAGEGLPQDVDQALVDVVDGEEGLAEVPVVVARRISGSVAARLRARGLGWADERGHARIAAPPGLLVARGGAVAVQPAAEGWRWSASSGAVAEYLLAMHGERTDPGDRVIVPPIGAIAGTVQISPAQVSKVLQGFDRQDWTRKAGSERGPGARRVVDDPSGLLSSWASWQGRRHERSVRAHATWRGAADFVVERLAPVLPDGTWCLTGWLAADERAPFATEVPTITCYLEPEYFDDQVDHVLDAAHLRRVERGARVVFTRAEPHVVGLSRMSAIGPVASDARLYADLLAAGARGEEAADHLREVVLGY